jgi:hypothetical protein
MGRERDVLDIETPFGSDIRKENSLANRCQIGLDGFLKWQRNPASIPGKERAGEGKKAV